MFQSTQILIQNIQKNEARPDLRKAASPTPTKPPAGQGGGRTSTHSVVGHSCTNREGWTDVFREVTVISSSGTNMVHAAGLKRFRLEVFIQTERMTRAEPAAFLPSSAATRVQPQLSERGRRVVKVKLSHQTGGR